MPYIEQEARDWFGNEMAPLLTLLASGSATPGDMNYIITSLLQANMMGHLNYALVNEAVGILECVKLELYRRLAAPYEDRKMQENGDVY